MTMKATPKAAETVAQLGDVVEYRDSSGRVKAAMVTATAESMGGVPDAQSGTEPPAPGNLHLRVFSFTGSAYAKFNVQPGDGPGTWSLIA